MPGIITSKESLIMRYPDESTKTCDCLVSFWIQTLTEIMSVMMNRRICSLPGRSINLCRTQLSISGSDKRALKVNVNEPVRTQETVMTWRVFQLLKSRGYLDKSLWFI